MLNNERRTHSLITCLYKTCFYNIGLISSNSGPFTRNAIARKSSTFDTVDFSGKLLDTWISWTWTAWISWTFGSLEGAIGFLTSRIFGNFDVLTIWIFWQFGSWTFLATSTSCNLFDDYDLLTIFLGSSLREFLDS